MNIYDALDHLPAKKKAYFTWKHDIRFKRDNGKKSKEQFLKEVQMKTLDSFIKWERTSQYKSLVMLLMESRIASDFEEIYKVVTDSAKKGEEKSIRLFLTLQSDIQKNAKLAAKTFDTVEDEQEEDDDLVLD
ncbi:hypothetical protein [Peribacillus sp. Hz7]|uniref:hypothetical protein n=1 Tax=Peribacillus sp. Hz7 TaxID=3344873 RepID=UPI0035C9E4CD